MTNATSPFTFDPTLLAQLLPATGVTPALQQTTQTCVQGVLDALNTGSNNGMTPALLIATLVLDGYIVLDTLRLASEAAVAANVPPPDPEGDTLTVLAKAIADAQTAHAALLNAQQTASPPPAATPPAPPPVTQ